MVFHFDLMSKKLGQENHKAQSSLTHLFRNLAFFPGFYDFEVGMGGLRVEASGSGVVGVDSPFASCI